MTTLLDVYNSEGQPIPGAVELLYDILRERPAEANISHKELPSFEDHDRYVRSRPYRTWLLVLNDYQQRVGAVYLSNLNEIGIAILKKYQRMGYAQQALDELRKIPPLPAVPGQRNGHYLANVAPRNEASHALFTKAGARPIQVTYEIP